MKLILHYLKRYKKLFIINVISVFGFALVELGIPTIVADMLDVGVGNADTNYLMRMDLFLSYLYYRCRYDNFIGILLCKNLYCHHKRYPK